MNWERVSARGGDAWDFDKNDTLEGKYVGKKTEVGPNESNMYLIDTGEETVSVWGSTVIDNQMVQVPRFAKVRICYVGKATSEKTNREYKDYTIDVWRGEGEKTDEIDSKDIPF